jgi:hypothetical protein
MNHLSVTKTGRLCLAFTLTIASGLVGLQAQAPADSNASTIKVPGEGLDPAAVQARKVWRETMHAIPAPASGCFHATFPITNWEEVECEAPSAYHSAAPASKEQTTGNGFDYVAQAPSGHYFSSVLGGFPETKDVASEKGVGVASFGGGGVLGNNEYTLQMNTNIHHSAACLGYSQCKAWEQYIISSNYVALTGKPIGKTAVFIEYWLSNFGKHTGKNICPKGFIDFGKHGSGPGDDCVQNSPATVMHSGIIPITDLVDLELGASAKHGGSDEATGFFGNESFKISVKDSLTDISTVWNQAEFNVVGNAGGSRATFNSGAELLVGLILDYGSTKAPACESPAKIDGTTGETNNLSLGQCVAAGGKSPYIEFVEGD